MPIYQDSWEVELTLNLATCNSESTFTTSRDLIDANEVIKMNAERKYVPEDGYL